MILGVDEVGRGPWAGPLVVGAVVLADEQSTELVRAGLTDSKKLTKRQRESLARMIHASATSIGLGWVTAEEIDSRGLSQSLSLATRRAVEQINTPYHQIIIDGTINFLRGTFKEPYVTTLKKADTLIPAVSAAAIVAKVARDAYMCEQDAIYPGYHFASHVGYGTAQHQEAIKSLGITPLHRLSFRPLIPYHSPKQSMTTKQIGDHAEGVVVNQMEAKGHVVIARNWRTRWCEIDIITRKDDMFHFIEVKYRRTRQQGGGIAALTPKKLQQMRFSAELFLAAYPREANAILVAAEVTGNAYTVTSLLELE